MLKSTKKRVFPGVITSSGDGAYTAKRNYKASERLNVDLYTLELQNEKRENPKNVWPPSARRIRKMQREEPEEFQKVYRFRSKTELRPSRSKRHEPFMHLRWRKTDEPVPYPPHILKLFSKEDAENSLDRDKAKRLAAGKRLCELPEAVIETILDVASKNVGAARANEAWARSVMLNVLTDITLEHLCGDKNKVPTASIICRTNRCATFRSSKKRIYANNSPSAYRCDLLPKRSAFRKARGSLSVEANTTAMQHDAFGPDSLGRVCPACGHRLLHHGFGPCREIVGEWYVRYLDAHAFQVGIPGCGCAALVCECGHAMHDHGAEGCEHRTRDIYDLGERDCDCKRPDLELWDIAVAAQRIGENRAIARRALEVLRQDFADEPKIVELIADGAHRAEAGQKNRLLEYVDVVLSVEADKGRHDSDGALEALKAYGLVLARLSGGPDIDGEPAVVRALRLAEV